MGRLATEHLGHEMFFIEDHQLYLKGPDKRLFGTVIGVLVKRQILEILHSPQLRV